jgi:predicted dehydrogenase
LQAFDNMEDLIKDTDVIHVCTTPVIHEQIVIAALQQDKYVVVEKTFTGYFGDGSDEFKGDICSCY